MPVGIIVGTGMAELAREEGWSAQRLETPHGPAEICVGQWGSVEVALIARHGLEFSVAPHAINYQANLEALEMLGCRQIIATNAVGSMLGDLGPGSLALPSQFLDFTHQRPRTLFDRPDDEPRFTDMTEPYCPELRGVIAGEAERLGLGCREELTYVCTEGPRFETPAEIRMFGTLGAHLVGMTGVPEVVFARELGLCYASLCIVTNLGAGMSSQPVSAGEVHEVMDKMRPRLRELLEATVRTIDQSATRACCVARQ